MRLLAISDLHLANPANRQALAELPPHPDDWLVVAGDVGETEEHLHLALTILTRRFAQVLWVPGNHDLWSVPSDPAGLRGAAKYERLVQICRRYGVLTPEDPYPLWRGLGSPCILVPLFLLYDYSFRPDDVPAEEAVAWAAESGVVCSDEFLLHPDPYPSRAAWCAARCDGAERRIAALSPALPLVLINHFPLQRDLAYLPRIPRFSLWCGTRRTESWHWRYPVSAVVYGHLHIRTTLIRDGVRCEEVSFGYPRDWDHTLGMEPYLRQILPAPVPLRQGVVLPPARYLDEDAGRPYGSAQG